MPVLQEQFLVGRLYRLANGTENPQLRGKVVAYLGHYPNTTTAQMGGPSHLVGLVQPDGSTGDRYLVRASIICRL